MLWQMLLVEKTGSLNCLLTSQEPLLEEMDQMEMEVKIHGSNGVFATVVAQSIVIEEIKLRQVEDPN